MPSSMDSGCGVEGAIAGGWFSGIESVVGIPAQEARVTQTAELRRKRIGLCMDPMHLFITGTGSEIPLRRLLLLGRTVPVRSF